MLPFLLVQTQSILRVSRFLSKARQAAGCARATSSKQSEQTRCAMDKNQPRNDTLNVNRIQRWVAIPHREKERDSLTRTAVSEHRHSFKYFSGQNTNKWMRFKWVVSEQCAVDLLSPTFMPGVGNGGRLVLGNQRQKLSPNRLLSTLVKAVELPDLSATSVFASGDTTVASCLWT